MQLSANAPLLFGPLLSLEYSVCNTVTQHENSAFSISYKLEFVVVAPILLTQSTGHYFRSAKCHTMPLFKAREQ